MKYLDLIAELSAFVSDKEVVEHLYERLSSHGVLSVHRFNVLEKLGERHYLIRFEDMARAIKASSIFGLDSFGFNCVLVKLPAV